jgi:two-component system alkaline phosphatase synthesis response regulator PhoP
MKPRVLLVDDEPDFLELLEWNLRRRGYDVITAKAGLEALNKARRESPNVILLDLMLPDLDGFAVCEILSAQSSTRDMPVIILSALDAPPNRQRGERLHVSAYCRKGIDFEALEALIRTAIEQHHARIQVRVSSVPGA